jgi:hypothetical protein
VLNRERLALALAVCGMAPFFAVWLFGLVEPHESSGRLVSRIVRGLAYFAFGTYFPATLCIIGSFKVFFGPGQNPPLMALRLIWGSMAIAVPLVLYFFILPGLG